MGAMLALPAVLDRVALLLRMVTGLVPRVAGIRAGKPYTVGDRLEDQARKIGGSTAILFEAERWTYDDWNGAANRVAWWAADQGIGRGEVVALLMENRPEFLATWMGLAKVGAVTALINTNLTGKALRHALSASNARHLVVGSECLDRLATTEDDLERPLRVWVARDPHAPARPIAWPAHAEDLDATLAEMTTANPPRAFREGVVTGDDLFYIYTSGTTGLPKAARLSHLRFLTIGDLAAWAVGLKRTDVHYCALPLYHTAGGVMLIGAALSTGATIALRRKFSARAFWDDVREYDVTHFQYIGEICRYLLNQPPRADDREHRLRAMIGNGLRSDVWTAFQERFGVAKIVEFYGATEGNAPIVNLENRVGSVGRYPFKAMSNARLIRYDLDADEPVRDAQGLCIECPVGEAGELVGKIPDAADNAQGRFEGYTSKEATDKKVLRDVLARGDAWFRSGDLLRQDEQGFYYFVDRIGDTYRWKGENVSTQEVAEAVSAYPGLELVNVYGVAVGEQDGRAGMAALLLTGGTSFAGERFYDHVDRVLPRYAAPLFVRLLPEMEMTGTFKLRKVTLQEEGFDPGRIAEPLFFRDDEARRYVPLDSALAAAIQSGARKV
jgi:fatty-acyl-CoA synthase